MPALSDTQKGVLRNALAALGVSLGLVVLAINVFPAPDIADTPADRLAFALPWLLVSLLALFFSVGFIARHRFFWPATTDGSNPSEDVTLNHARAFLQNTLEQIMLHTLVLLTLAVVLPADWLQVIPVLAVWFLIGRILFRIYYLSGAPARAFGFGATYYGTVIGYALALWFWILE